MGFKSLQLRLGKVILTILLLDCLACSVGCANLPQNGVSSEGQSILMRSRSALEVSPSQGNGTTAEADILLEFRKGVTVDPYNVLSSWNSNNISNYCTWPGVNCSSKVGPVNAINLPNYLLTGTISPSLGRLRFLSYLDLSNNSFEGTIPSSITNCSYLTVLKFSLNSLTGVLPPSLSNLSALRVLSVDSNQMYGDIRSLAWGGFRQLESLNLSYNCISGEIPESFSNCSSLSYFDLSFNNFTGTITDIFPKLQKLKWFDLGINYLTGSIPISLGSLKALTSLILVQNQLTGEIPSEIGMLSNLHIIDLGYNALTGPIPPSLLNCSFLTGVYFYSNRLVGEIPSEIGMLSELQGIFLSNNNLSGSIPPSLVNCTNLTNIDFTFNSLTGGVPADLGNISTLQEVLLHGNWFTGGIPSQLGLLKKMSKLDLSSNFLGGQIPSSLGNSTALLSLNLANNRFGGQVPPWIGELTNLQGLFLSGNQFTGGIPAGLSNCTSLFVLDVGGNFLSDGIPDELGTLTALNHLYLNNNNFTGSISSAIRPEWTKLIGISLAYNSFSGSIAEYDFGTLRDLQLTLDLSHNLFSGSLPSGIGALASVQTINLSFNAFSGDITDALGQCMGLEALDLSFNNLEGKLPESLTNLHHLTFFNVSFNQLTGPVPDSGQFVNFTNASFLGNPNLCGPMLSHKCSSSSRAIRRHRHRHRLPIIIGGVTGVLLGFALFAIWFLVIMKAAKCRGSPAPTLSNSGPTRGVQDLNGGHLVATINSIENNLSESIVLETIDDPSGENVIGVGAKSIVYKGVLPGGESFALKRLLSPMNGHNQNKGDVDVDDLSRKKECELVKEAVMLAQFRHKNILKFLSFYSSLDHKALILEYMCGGSLHKQLHEMEPCELRWQTRLKVAIGVAHGLTYLHHDFPDPLIHRDLKPSNILLDEEFEPKVADFGISKFVNAQQGDGEASASTFCGTMGYMPPEYASQPWVSTKGDVYSYGMVLIELLTRRQPCSTDALNNQGSDLRSWVLDHFLKGRPLELLDPFLIRECSLDDIAMEQIMFLLRVSVFCTRVEPQSRPSMINVVGMLVNIMKMGEEPVVRRSVGEIAKDTNPTLFTGD